MEANSSRTLATWARCCRPHTGARELASLASFAHAQVSNEEFRKAVLAPEATTSSMRRRLVWLDEAVIAAKGGDGVGGSGTSAPALTWRLLFGLRVIEMRLEANDPADRTATVVRLRDCVGEAAEADHLFAELSRLASSYAPQGATVDEAMLRRDLSGVVRVGRSPSFRQAWEILDGLEQRLRQNTRRSLSSAGEDGQLALLRSAALDRLVMAIKDAVSTGRSLVVTGDPDVGKSALALAAADALRSQDEVVVSVSLRDLPPSLPETVRLFGAPMNIILGSMAVSPTRMLIVDGAEAALEDRFHLLASLGESARRAGIGLVAVTRSDARGRAVEALSAAAPGHEAPMEVEVAGLTIEEVAEVTEAFPSLARLSAESRSAWLVQRPGLIDLLLRSDAIASLPDGALSEGRCIRSGLASACAAIGTERAWSG